MKQEALQAWEGTGYSLLAMVLFLMTFLGLCAWTWRRGTGDHYEAMSRLPFEEDDV